MCRERARISFLCLLFLIPQPRHSFPTILDSIGVEITTEYNSRHGSSAYISISPGMLTPEEFVAAGDHLVHTCPTWAWATGDERNVRTYLPPNKQYLITKGVPSYRRAVDMMSDNVLESMVGGDADGANDDWCAPSVTAADHSDEVLVGAEEGKESSQTPAAVKPMAATTPAVDEYADMDTFEDEDLVLDDAAVAPTAAAGGEGGGGNDGVLSARRYDVSITYDNYYRTPRVFLFGYDESGSPLSTERIFDDIMQDYANRTVTIENHPHTTRPQASIHPCQHGAAMKRVIEALHESNKVPSVDQYLFIFLKFLQSVIPTIEYDYTVGANFGGGSAS